MMMLRAAARHSFEPSLEPRALCAHPCIQRTGSSRALVCDVVASALGGRAVSHSYRAANIFAAYRLVRID
jgi:hypothetical protein